MVVCILLVRVFIYVDVWWYVELFVWLVLGMWVFIGENFVYDCLGWKEVWIFCDVGLGYLFIYSGIGLLGIYFNLFLIISGKKWVG